MWSDVKGDDGWPLSIDSLPFLNWNFSYPKPSFKYFLILLMYLSLTYACKGGIIIITIFTDGENEVQRG